MRMPTMLEPMLKPLLELDLGELDLLDAEVLGVDLPTNYLDPGAAGQATVDAATQAALEAVRTYPGAALEAAIARGLREENQLTDLEFFGRHPERGGAKIEKSEKDLAKEWLELREKVVRPALAKAGAPPRPAGAPAPAPAPGSNAAVAEQVAATSKRNQIIAIGLGALAALGIGVAATR